LLRSPNYLAAVNGILEKKSYEVIHAYLIWTTIRYFIGHTDVATRKPWEDFVNVLYGIDPCKREDRWKTCIREVDNTLGFLAGEFYVRENFN